MNGNGSALNQTSNSTPIATNQQVPNSLYTNLNRGMKENFFIAAINQTTNGGTKQAIMNGLQNQSQLANTLVQQQQQFNQTTSSSIQALQAQQLQHQTNGNTANTINNCQQFYQQQQTQQLNNTLRLKNLNANTAAALLNGTQATNQAAMYRAFNDVNTLNCKQQAAANHQLINNLTQQQQNVINQQANASQTNGTSNTGSILLNISNHNNHSNSHFNHYNQHQTTSNQNAAASFYNGFPLNYHLQQTGQTPYYHHSNSLSSSPRSSTSSTSSSSLINYNQLQNGLAKYQQQQQQQNGQHSPTNSATSSPTVVNAPLTQLTQTSGSKQLASNGHPKIVAANKTNQSIQSAQQQINNNSNVQTANAQNGSRYKTELCRPFEESGFCKYSDKVKLIFSFFLCIQFIF